MSDAEKKTNSSGAGTPPAESTKATGTAACTSAGEIPAAFADPRARECCWAVKGTLGRLSPMLMELKITLQPHLWVPSAAGVED